MGQLGIGAMLGRLCGNKESVEAITSVLNKKIKSVRVDEEMNALRFEFEDGTKFKIFDDGQSCCESRYMRTDDDLSEFEGAVFQNAELKDAPNIEDEYGDHEVQFLEIQTDKGVFTCSNHNEHNGYYGGFWIICALEGV